MRRGLALAPLVVGWSSLRSSGPRAPCGGAWAPRCVAHTTGVCVRRRLWLSMSHTLRRCVACRPSGGGHAARPSTPCALEHPQRRPGHTPPRPRPSSQPLSESAAVGVGRHASTPPRPPPACAFDVDATPPLHRRVRRRHPAPPPACAFDVASGWPCRTPSAGVWHARRQEVGRPHDPRPRVGWSTLRDAQATRHPDPGGPADPGGPVGRGRSGSPRVDATRHASAPPRPCVDATRPSTGVCVGRRQGVPIPPTLTRRATSTSSGGVQATRALAPGALDHSRRRPSHTPPRPPRPNRPPTAADRRSRARGPDERTNHQTHRPDTPAA